MQIYHPESVSTRNLSNSSSFQSDSDLTVSPDSPDVNPLQYSSVLSRLLSKQAPRVKYPKAQPKTSARVLTASENLSMIAEKERKKRKTSKGKERKEIKGG